VQSYYQASRNTQIDQPELIGDHDADVCVIGGGYTGLSTALYLANEGLMSFLLSQIKLHQAPLGQMEVRFLVECEEINFIWKKL